MGILSKHRCENRMQLQRLSEPAPEKEMRQSDLTGKGTVRAWQKWPSLARKGNKLVPVTKTCPGCNKNFQCKPSHVELRTYCSLDCRNKAYNKRQKLTCLTCGDVFYVANNKHRHNAKYCSKKCMGTGMSGENHSMWKGGLTNDLEHLREYARKRYHKNPEACIRNAKKRKLRMKEIPGSHTHQEWKELLRSYNWKCVYCGITMVEKTGPDQITRDHIIPVTKGGTDDIENIVPACRSCNSKKNDRIDYLPLLVSVTNV